MSMRKERSVDSFNQESLTVFSDELASNAPVPGGGGSCAYAGALAASLGEMVCHLTIGKKKYRDRETDLTDLCGKLEEERKILLSLVDEDAKGFEPLAYAYRLPHATEEEKAFRNQLLEEGYQKAADAPMQIMESCARTIELLEEAARLGTPLALSDVGVGAAFARSALEGASLNVYINTKYMKDRESAKTLNSDAYDMTEEYAKRAGELVDTVRRELLIQ